MNVDRGHCGLELRRAGPSRLPFGDLAVGADAVGERALDALERQRRLHQRAERDRAGEIGRA